MVFDNKGKEKKDAIWSVRDCRKAKPDTTNGEVGEISYEISHGEFLTKFSTALALARVKVLNASDWIKPWCMLLTQRTSQIPLIILKGLGLKWYQVPQGIWEYIMESLILAQNERWRRVLSMQVERQAVAIQPRVADWWVTRGWPALELGITIRNSG